MATMVKELTGSKFEIVFRPLPQDNPVRRRPNITPAMEKLGREPILPLREVLVPIIAYFRELLKSGI